MKAAPNLISHLAAALVFATTLAACAVTAAIPATPHLGAYSHDIYFY